jgi:hypothetical protein
VGTKRIVEGNELNQSMRSVVYDESYNVIPEVRRKKFNHQSNDSECSFCKTGSGLTLDIQRTITFRKNDSCLSTMNVYSYGIKNLRWI